MECDQNRLLQVQLLDGWKIGTEGKSPQGGHRKLTKGEKLIVRLILGRGELVSVEELLDIAGLEQEDEKSLQSLKVHIHRLRKRLGDMEPGLEDCILTWKRSYAWNMERSRVDLYEAERTCRRVLTTQRASALKMEDVEAITRMYEQKLLPKLAEEDWVEKEAGVFEQLQIGAMSKALTLMWQSEAYDLLIRTCHLGMVYAPYEPLYWENLTRAMACMEQRGEITFANHRSRMTINKYIQQMQGDARKAMSLTRMIAMGGK